MGYGHKVSACLVPASRYLWVKDLSVLPDVVQQIVGGRMGLDIFKLRVGDIPDLLPVAIANRAAFLENILDLARRLESAKNNISDSGKKELQEMWKLLSREAENVVKALNSTDDHNINLALKVERKINKMLQFALSAGVN